jgi:hypothetical protein
LQRCLLIYLPQQIILLLPYPQHVFFVIIRYKLKPSFALYFNQFYQLFLATLFKKQTIDQAVNN